MPFLKIIQQIEPQLHAPARTIRDLAFFDKYYFILTWPQLYVPALTYTSFWPFLRIRGGPIWFPAQILLEVHTYSKRGRYLHLHNQLSLSRKTDFGSFLAPSNITADQDF